MKKNIRQPTEIMMIVGILNEQDYNRVQRCSLWGTINLGRIIKMTFESEMMCWLLLLVFVWAIICCIWEELENRNPLDDYYDSFEYQRSRFSEGKE